MVPGKVEESAMEKGAPWAPWTPGGTLVFSNGLEKRWGVPQKTRRIWEIFPGLDLYKLEGSCNFKMGKSANHYQFTKLKYVS